MDTEVTAKAPKSTQSSTSQPPSPRVTKEDSAADSSLLDIQYFYEDEVFSIDKKGRVKFGLVLESADIPSADEDDEEPDVLSKGELRVIWHPEGREDVVTEELIGLADRTLMPGDVVRRLVPGKDTQRGYCREISMRSDVRIVGTRNIVKNVISERLLPVIQMPRDGAVCLDSWVGSVKGVSEKIVLQSSCGALIEMSDLDLLHFQDVNTKFRGGHFTDIVYYPGQLITGRIKSMERVTLLSPDVPLKLNRNGKPISKKFKVESVHLDSVWVHWQCKALSEDSDIKSDLLQQPDPCVTGKDLERLKRLNLFESCTLQINDKCYLKIADCDTVLRKSQWEKDLGLKYKRFIDPKNLDVKHSTERRKSKTSSLTLDQIITTPLDKMVLKALTIKPLNRSNGEQPATGSTEKSDVESSAEGAKASTDDWQTEDEEDEVDLDGNDETASTATTVSTCSSPTPRSSPKRSSRVHKKPDMRLKKKDSKQPTFPAIGEEVVTETMVVYSTATVVWQDGSVEKDIASTQLYPIHHLDDHEFFPGDFVVSDKTDNDVSFRDYGVIQTVDHHGRTALVKWFTTYASSVEPKPTYKGQSEVSVYDLKDHPDFQFRPGTMVIRVANFIGEDAICTAGQIIDNYIEGRVKVWWVDGHISMCWPQDLFEVGQYGHSDWANDTDDSWETESESSEFGGSTPQLKFSESHILSNFEKARVAVARLEEILNINPHLQNHEVMRKLLAVYKNCRYIDRLLGTSFFHEDNFPGLLQRVRKAGNQTASGNPQADRKNRLFSESTCQHSQQALGIVIPVNSTPTNLNGVTSPKEYAPKVIFNISSTPFKNAKKKASNNASQEFTDLQSPQKQLSNQSTNSKISLSDSQKNPYNQERNKLLSSVMLNIEKATEKTNQLKFGTVFSQLKVQEESRTDHCDNNATSSNDPSNISLNNNQLKATDDQKSISCSSIELTEDVPEYVCTRLCCLLKEQLAKCINEIRQKYYVDNLNLSEVIKSERLDDVKDEVLSNDQDTCSVISVDPKSPQVPEKSIQDSDTFISPPQMQPVPSECFQTLDTAPKNHKFELTILNPSNPQQYYKAIQREHKMLRNSLPPGVWVRVFEDRMDLMSVMIEGPKNTPYEDGLFFFDMQMGHDYPKSPPHCHYISFCTDRLNPNLYEDGKVCVSLLGTWSGRDTETWTQNSTLLQVIVSIQGLILVPEPYFNEAGYEKQKGTQQGAENSRMYNEMTIIKLVQSMTKVLSNPPIIFREHIEEHFRKKGMSIHTRIKRWMELSQDIRTGSQDEIESLKSNPDIPEFPLVPASRGFCLTLNGLLQSFRSKLEAIGGAT